MQKDLALIILPPAIWPVLDYALEIGLCFCEKNPSSVLYLISVDRTLRFNPSNLSDKFTKRSTLLSS